jgi:hypothetical protein
MASLYERVYPSCGLDDLVKALMYRKTQGVPYGRPGWPTKAQVLQFSPDREESTVGRAKVLIASYLWVVASLTPSWAASVNEAPHPYPFSLSEETTSCSYIDLKGFRLGPLGTSYVSSVNETDRALQGVRAQYDMGFGSYRIEFSGGYAPGMKSLYPSEAPHNPRGYLGYIDLRIPLWQFYVKGGAFFAQNLEALDLLFNRPSEEQNTERDLLGYQIGGGYRISDSLSIQAGWGQAAHEYETAKEGLRAWYFQARINMGWRMSVTPQVGYIDFTKEDGERIREEAFYCGARWQINF